MKRLIFCVVAFCLSFSVLAQSKGDPNKYSTPLGNSACRFFDGFADNGDGTVTDPRNGVVWKRCAEGMTWNGSACSGKTVDMDWFTAMKAAKFSRFLGKSDWRLPSKEELSSIVGNYDQGCNKNPDGQYAASGDVAWPLTKESYPGLFWSYSPYVGSSKGAWTVAFDRGYISNSSDDRSGRIHVRLVRSIQSQGSTAALNAFNSEYGKMGLYRGGISADEQEADRRRANENSPSNQSRKMCEAQKRTCFASCPPYNMDNPPHLKEAHFSCERQCNAISCN